MKTFILGLAAALAMLGCGPPDEEELAVAQQGQTLCQPETTPTPNELRPRCFDPATVFPAPAWTRPGAETFQQQFMYTVGSLRPDGK